MQVGATRRELVRTGIGVAAAGSLAGLAASAVAATSPTAAETEALSYALQTERLSVIVYRQVLASNVVSAGVASQLRVLLGQDLQHAARLEQVLRKMGAAIPQGPTGVAAAQAMLREHSIHRSLTALHSQYDGLRLLIDAESLTEGAYFKAIPDLQDSALIRLSVAIMGSDAQHWAVLSGIQHPGDFTTSVPYPFVQGSP
jgi:Ferritin-like domain